MKAFVIKKSKKIGKGVFAARDIKRGEHILRCDLTKIKAYTRKEIAKHPQKYSHHWDEVGRGKWALDFSPSSYVNHSCNPNCATKYYNLLKKDLVALRDIEKGEELTVDYSTVSLYDFGTHRVMGWKCRCGDKACRKKVTADFFDLPIRLQKRYYTYLPPTIKRKFRDRIARLRKAG